MKRNAILHMIAWKENKNKKPLWMNGIRGVGKTYLSLDFAKSFFDGNLYVNFETTAMICSVVKKAYNSIENDKNLIELLCAYYQIPSEYIGNLIFIFDEIGACKEAVTMLEELTRAGSNIPILVISSEEVEHDVNLFEELRIYPMEFDEFLVAEGNEWYSEVIKGHYQTSRKVPEIVHKELLTSFEDYLVVGGMPAAVNEYIAMEGTLNVSNIHLMLYQNLRNRAMEYQPSESEALKVAQIFDVMPEQLMKQNKKFQYRLIRKGATYALYKQSIQSLVQNGYFYKCCKNTYDKNQAELKEDSLQFKLFLPDVGIFNSLIMKEEPFIEMKGSYIQKCVLENYMMQSLTARGFTPNFWESNSLAKIDFIIDTPEGIVPIDTKTADNARNKSISVFRASHEIPYAIRVSSRNFEFTNHVKNIPYYSIFCLK